MSVPSSCALAARNLTRLRNANALSGRTSPCLYSSNLCLRARSQSTATNASKSTLDTNHKLKSDVLDQGELGTRKLPPHSRLSTKMLLRSFMVSTISSYPFLLRPALNFLLLVTKKPFALLDVSRNRLLHALLKKTFYDHFCAGENRNEVTSTVQSIKDMGCKGVILTYAREIVVDEKTGQDRGLGAQEASGNTESTDLPEKEKYADIDTWREGVLETLDMVREGDILALKLTGAGLAVTQSLRENKPLPPAMQEALDVVCNSALKHKVGIFIDAEQQSAQPEVHRIALGLMRKYNREGICIVYNTYQMYLKHMIDALNQDMQSAADEGFTLGVKLVRGAYIASEPRHLIHDTKEDTDWAYDESLKAMLQCKYVPQHKSSSKTSERDVARPIPSIGLFVASHNKESSLAAVDWHQQRLSEGLPTVQSIYYGQLQGMADGVSCELLQLKDEAMSGSSKLATEESAPKVYKCLSWGTLEDCLSYLLRRAVENQDAVGRTVAERVATRAELFRRMRVSLGIGR